MNADRHDIAPLRHVPPADAEVVRIATALCEGTATTTDCHTLEALLDDPDAMAAYLALMEHHAALSWRNNWRADPGAWLAPEVLMDSAPLPTAADRPSCAQSDRRVRRWAMPLLGAGAAVAIAVVAALLPVRPPHAGNAAHATAPLARLTAASHARWSSPTELREGDGVEGGPMRLLEGRAQLQFASGASVVLNGPVDMELVTATRVFLRSGRITPFVPPEARGFTVVSPSGEVVDLGTEFSVGVDASGLTSVYVIDGEVDVTTGHARRQPPLRMSQGFGAELSGPAATSPAVTQTPIIIDHFDDDAEPSALGAGDLASLRWIDLDPAAPAVVRNGALRIPFRDDPGWADPAVRILLDHDFTTLVGRRSVISFKVLLPPGGSVGVKRWLALVIDGRSGADAAQSLPLAHAEETSAAVMVSPIWQAGVRIDGRRFPCAPLFRRSEDAVGPYQVVVAIDDSPAGRLENGGTRLDVMVNGVEFTTSQIIDFRDHPRLGFHTYVPRGKGWQGEAWAVVDDFSVSIDTAARPASDIDRGAP